MAERGILTRREPGLTIEPEPKTIEDYPLLLSPTEAAEIVRLEPKTVMGLCAAGKIPARKVGGAWRIRRDVLWEWLRGA